MLATNPCHCGNYGVPGAECTCPSLSIRRYLSRLSGPLRDRIDIDLGVQRVSTALSATDHARARSADVRQRVVAARERAAHRLRGTPWHTNAEASGAWLRNGPLAPARDVRQPLDAALQRGSLTLRGYDRVLRVAWSVADLAGHEHLHAADVGRALYLKKGTTA